METARCGGKEQTLDESIGSGCSYVSRALTGVTWELPGLQAPLPPHVVSSGESAAQSARASVGCQELTTPVNRRVGTAPGRGTGTNEDALTVDGAISQGTERLFGGAEPGVNRLSASQRDLTRETWTGGSAGSTRAKGGTGFSETLKRYDECSPGPILPSSLPSRLWGSTGGRHALGTKGRPRWRSGRGR